ncbi:hypothetical protein [Cytobacillus firmus]|uniref:hypothetical protein n=1 Tax=Cytobacillus firmus TaxID=1399 RepID=UPI0018CCD64A|nr:hypothetical protein [Cytobacillus firmus]MED1906139.1 hypothetical protein [Cytobacillus firmus]MED1941554.1 hypothetical protein [Cytobacillus firmus]
MDLSNATDQQLYEIAKDENARMKDRYAAACELQRRKKTLSKDSYRKVNVPSGGSGWF